MSFSVDLWNGTEIIKKQVYSVLKKIKTISKVISSYLAIEANYHKSLENLYKENKESINSENILDKSYLQILDIFEYENQNRKIFCSFVNQIVMEPLNEYLRQPNILLNKCFSDNTFNEENFKRTLGLLKEKQINFWKECKELAVLLAQNEIEETDNKFAKTKNLRVNEKLNKLNTSKQEYIDCIKESNKVRENYNKKTENILNTIEKIYLTMLEKFESALINFAMQRNELLYKMYNKEKNEYDNIHSKVDIHEELTNFIQNNATKEFPRIKFEFCPLKYSVINQIIKNKCNKNPETDFPKLYKIVKEFFENNKIFKEEINYKTARRNTDFFSIFSTKKIASKDSIEINNNEEKEDKEFIENYITDLFENDSSNNKKAKLDNKKENKEKTEDNNKDNKSNNNIEQKTDNKETDINKEEKEENNSQNKIQELNNKEEANTQKEKSENIENKNEILTNKENIKKEEESLEEEKSILSYFYQENPNFFKNVEILIKHLSYLRSKGYFNISEKAYNTILSLFLVILNIGTKNDYILKNILILSQTFYKTVNNKKLYLQQGIKGKKIFADPKTWHRVINYSMNLSCTSMDLSQTKEDMIKKINKEAVVIVVAYLCDIKQYTDDENVFNKVKDYYVKVYNMDESMINKEVEKYIASLKSKENIENIKSNINILENEDFIKQRSYSIPLNIKKINEQTNINNDNKKDDIMKNSNENIIENKEDNNKDIINNDINKEKENPEIKEIKDNNIIESQENKNQIINNNINIIKIEAKEVIIVEKSKDNINIEHIEQIKSLKKEENDKIKQEEIKEDENKEIKNTNEKEEEN